VAITNGYCTLAQIKAAVGIEDGLADALLEMAVDAASRLIDAECDRVFYTTDNATRVFLAVEPYVVATDDLTAVTTVELDDTGDGAFSVTLLTSDYQLEPLNGLSGGGAYPYTRVRMIGAYTIPIWGGQATVRITGDYGFAPTPAQVTQACVIQASRIYKRLDSPLGVAGFGDMGAMRVGKTDPDVAMLIRPYKKHASA